MPSSQKLISGYQSYSGLSSIEVGRAREQFGPNSFDTTTVIHPLKKIAGLLVNPISLILILAALASALFGNLVSATIIATMMLLSMILDFINTYRSQRAVQRLARRVQVSAMVMRNGQANKLPVSELVPGDVVSLTAGNIIPADGEILTGNSLYASEAALTGESFPQSKPVGCPVYMGTAVMSGEGLMRVTATGHHSRFAQIAKSLTAQVRPTEYERELRAFGRLILIATIILVVFVFIVNVVFAKPLLESLLFSLALAVGLTPEMLPLIVTLNLTRGSTLMVRHGVIVKQLSAVQILGNMDVLCTDKTGTLTEDKIALVRYVNAIGQEDDRVLELGYVSSYFSTAYENPLDRAVESFTHISLRGWQKLAEIPFDFERKRELVVVVRPKSNRPELIVKGAPEQVLPLCASEGASASLSSLKRKKIERLYEQLSRDGFRVLAIASRPIHFTNESEVISQEENLHFEGFLAFLDPAKYSVTPTLEKMKQLGLSIRILTGDNELVTAKIAKEIGLTITGMVTGAALATCHARERERLMQSANVFCRVSPSQKMMIIQSLQAAGHVVGYLGDGINDAPSLRAADVGISVDNAVDVAKDAADLVLLRKNLHELIEGVTEGRKTFINTLKYLRMTLSSNFGNMFSMALSSLFLPFLPMKATQILLNNLLYDSSQFAIPFDAVDKIELAKPQTLSITHLRQYMWQFGLLSSFFDLLLFFLLFAVFQIQESSFQAVWFLESLMTQTLVALVIRTRLTPLVQSRPSWQLVTSVMSVIIIAALTVFVPALAKLFSFGPVSGNLIITVGAVVAAYLLCAELLKRYLNRGENRSR